MSEFGAEAVQILELDQERCQLDYGETTDAGTCPAALGVDGVHKCFNTFGTCQAPEAYTPETKTIRFARPQDGMLRYGVVVPPVDSISTTPARINLGAMDRGASALGQRESVTVRFRDH